MSDCKPHFERQQLRRLYCKGLPPPKKILRKYKMINADDKLVKLAVIETEIKRVTCNDDREKICSKMCEYAKEDGVHIINKNNPNLCDSCSVYRSQNNKS